MKCPHCKLINPPNALRCDCGYDFASGQMQESYLGKDSSQMHMDVHPTQGSTSLDPTKITGTSAEASSVTRRYKQMFSTLRRLGGLVEVLGWIVGVVSALFLLGSLAVALGLATGDENFFVHRTMVRFVIWGSLSGIVSGILIVSYGQGIQCFVAIEENTRETAHLLLRLLPRN